MNQLTVDENKCTGCGKCQERCGFKKVIHVNEAGKASFKKDRSECIECYHCLKVCPNDAIGSNGDNIKLFRVTDETSSVLKRHSCRMYNDKQIVKNDLNDLLQDANLAPWAYMDFRDRKYLVVTGKKLTELRTILLKKINRESKVFRTLIRIPFLPERRKADLKFMAWCFTGTIKANKIYEQLFQGAPAVVLAVGPGKNPVSKVNCELAIMQLMILAEERGFGTCYSGYIEGYMNAISKFLRLPKNEKVFCGCMIGYPAATYTNYIRRNDTSITWI